MAFHVADRRHCPPDSPPRRPMSPPPSSSIADTISPRTSSSPTGGTTMRCGAHLSRGSSRTFMAEKWTSTGADDEPPVIPSSRGGWGQDDRDNVPETARGGRRAACARRPIPPSARAPASLPSNHNRLAMLSFSKSCRRPVTGRPSRARPW